MRALLLVFVLVAGLVHVPPTAADEAAAPGPRLVEIVADPQTDWDGDGRVSPNDEFVEILNENGPALDLAGWTLRLNDSSPTEWQLSGALEAGARRAFTNPPGEINNNGHVALVDPSGRVADELRFGSWSGNAQAWPDANAEGPADEALRFADGNWSKGHATPGAPPLGPFVRHAPPVDRAGEGWWDPGNRSITVSVDWADADRAYAGANLSVLGDPNAPPLAAAATFQGGRWTASWTWTTPEADFTYAVRLVDSAGHEWAGPTLDVRVDRLPPGVPVLPLPPWTNATGIALAALPVADSGVGGVEYAFEQWNASVGAWQRVGNWSEGASYGPVALGQEAASEFRALARDAYGNTAVGPAARVASDRTPPDPIQGIEARGYRQVHLTWAPAADSAAGVATLLVARMGPGAERAWELPGDATSLHDEEAPLGELVYTLQAVDAAGNAGAPAIVVPDHEGLHPHAALRINRAFWADGQLRVHADFDRRMEGAPEPRLLLEGNGTLLALDGRWLSNHTTFLATLDPDEPLPEGHASVRIADASDAGGHALWGAPRVTLVIDRTPPGILTNDADGWVGTAGFHAEARDALDPSPRLRVRLGNASATWHEVGPAWSAPPDGASEVWLDAEDAAGNQARALKRHVRVDLDPPRLDVESWGRRGGRSVAVRLADEGSGLDPATVRALDTEGRSLQVAPAGRPGRFDVTGISTPTLRILASDRVGNALDTAVAVPPLSLPSPTVSPAPAPRDGERLDREAGAAAQGPAGPAPLDVVTSAPVAPGLAALLLGGGALLARRRASSRRHRPRSLAARLRILRAAPEDPAPSSHA